MGRIIIENVTMRNFQSYGNVTTSLDFNDTGSILIKGIDLDNTDDGIINNGTGKTTILNAISYALYDSPITDVSTKDDLINNINKKKMKVTLNFKDRKGVFYKIERFRKMKSTPDGTGVKLLRRKSIDEEWKDISRDSKNTNKQIVEILGIPHELFKQIVLFTATTQPFLSLPKSHPTQPCQRTVMEHLFGFTELTKKADFLRKEKKDRKVDLELARRETQFQEKDNERYVKQLKEVKDRLIKWESDTQENIDNLKQYLSRADGLDFDLEKQLFSDITETKNQLQIAERNVKNTRKEIASIEKHIKSIDNEVNHLVNDQCPYCKQQYKDAEQKITTLSVERDNHQEQCEKLKIQYENQDKECEQLESILTELLEKQQVSNFEDLLDIKNQEERIKEKIHELEHAENPFVDQYEDLKNNPPKAVDYSEVNNLSKLIEHQEILIKLLTRNDSFVRKSLLEKNLPFLNGRLNLYLADMKLPFKVEFTDNLEAKINRFGRELSHGNVSNGQKARINIALSFAFRDVLQKLHAPFNVCFLDEALDFGLDPVGVIGAARLIKRKARDEGTCYYIVSHRDEIANIFDKQITVQLEDGFSSIKRG